MIDPLLSNTIRHSIGVTQFENFVLAKVIRVLNLTDKDLVAQIAEALADTDADSFKVQRLNKLLESVRELNTQAYDNLYGALTDELKDYSAYEAGFQHDLYKFSAPVTLSIASIVPEQVYAAAVAQPMEGRLLKEWASGLSNARLQRIKDTIAVGYTQGKTTADIVREIRGTKAANYADGILDIDRRKAEAIVRTAIGHTAQITRTKFYEENDDILGDIQWSSTLDGRTTHICRVRDGKRYTKDGKPVGHSLPWLGGPGRAHWGCRSSSISLLIGQKSLYGQRASENGPVDANVTYAEWLKEQSATVQDQVLGKTRGEMYRSGKYEMKDFSNDRGIMYSLKELREMDAMAFKR